MRNLHVVVMADSLNSDDSVVAPYIGYPARCGGNLEVLGRERGAERCWRSTAAHYR